MKKLFSVLFKVIGYLLIIIGIGGGIMEIGMCFSSNFIYWLVAVGLYVILGYGLIKLSNKLKDSNK